MGVIDRFDYSKFHCTQQNVRPEDQNSNMILLISEQSLLTVRSLLLPVLRLHD